MPPFNGQSEFNTVVNSSVSHARSRILGSRVVIYTLLYILGTMVAFGLTGYLGHFTIQQQIHAAGLQPGFWGFVATLVVVLGLGLLNLVVMPIVVAGANRSNYRLGIIFTVVTAFVGAVSMYILAINKATDINGLGFNVKPLIFSVLIFPMPFFIRWAYDAFILIPPPIYELWQYDPGYQLPHISDAQKRDATAAFFYVELQPGDSIFTELNTNNPRILSIGESFQLAINKWNYNNPQSENQIWVTPPADPAAPNDQTPYYDWHFLQIRPWYRPDTYIDHKRTWSHSFLTTGVKIKVQRVLS